MRKAMDRAGHPALLMVDTISSLASIDYRLDEWGVDVTVGGIAERPDAAAGPVASTPISDKALAASKSARLPRSYWDWDEMLAANETGFFPVHAGDQPVVRIARGDCDAGGRGLAERVRAARPARGGDARAQSVHGVGDVVREPAEYSSSLTAVLLPEGHDAERLRKVILERFDMSLGQGLGKLQGKIFRIGHLGDFNDLMLAGTLCGVEMGLALAGVPMQKAGVQAALDALAGSTQPEKTAARAAVA